MSAPVAIVGGGAFGRALATAAARVERSVICWSRSKREPDHARISCTTDMAALRTAELVFLAVPSPHVSALSEELGKHLDGGHLVVHVSRGLVGNDIATLTEVVRETTPVRRVGALAGPLVARGLAEGEPGGAIVGTLFPEVADAVRDALGGPKLRIYATDDVVGVEIASAFVGLITLAMGYAKSLGFGPGTLAMLATRGMAEATRVGLARGGTARTFAGLAGFGDLLAATADDGRPELALGRALAEGEPLQTAAQRLGAYVEGVRIAEQVQAYGERARVETPIAAAMAKLVSGEVGREEAVAALMRRPAGGE
ncbi:MAG: NAD(P)-binding domain-containing protein [Myxococcota bacterium]